jgi:hypothetical protein
MGVEKSGGIESRNKKGKFRQRAQAKEGRQAMERLQLVPCRQRVWMRGAEDGISWRLGHLDGWRVECVIIISPKLTSHKGGSHMMPSPCTKYATVMITNPCHSPSCICLCRGNMGGAKCDLVRCDLTDLLFLPLLPLLKLGKFPSR